MDMRNISAWSIRNPVVPIILFIGLLVAGIVAFMRMDVNDMPDVDFPAVTVTVVQPGAAPSEITTQITEKVEAAVRSISGVDEIQSTASEGNSLTIVQFQIGTDVNDATAEVKNAVDQIRSELPEGILEPQITKIEPGGGGPMGYFAVSADDMTMEQLSWFVDDTVSRRLLGIEGMAKVTRGGGVDREIRVVLDPARMQSLGVTAAQVNDTLRQVNVDAAGGRAEIAGSRQSVRVLGNARDAYDLSNTRISLAAGRTIKLSDVATVTDGYSEQTSIAKLQGRQVVTFSMQRAKGASDVSVYDGALEEMKQIQKENPGIRFTELFTTVNYTKGQYASSMEAMVEGAILAVIVVFFFLRDWRATIIASIAIPLSAIPTFWFMDLMGFTLNSLSLLALSLVAGVLVDDAIVEIENIVRHMRMGKSAYQAAIDAADEIGLAVVATTFSIVAVFLPVGLMPGISGQFFKNFGLSVVAAVLMSLAVARMVTPMVAAYFLKAHGEESHGEGRIMDGYMKILRWSLDRTRADAYRARMGRRTLATRFGARLRDHRVWMLGVGLVALFATFLLMGALPQQFQPTADQDWSQAKIEMVPGTTLEQTEAVADEVVAILEKQSEVERVIAVVEEAKADLYITLSADRDEKSFQFERRLTPQLQAIPDARVNFAQPTSAPGSGRDITVMLTGSDPAKLQETAQTLVEQMRGIKDLVAPRIDADFKRPELIIVPRFDLAAQLGVTTASLSQAIRIATLGEIDQNAAKFSLTDRQVPIRVILPKDSRRDIATIENLPVPTASGASVPLKRVAEIRFGAGPTQIQRYNQARRVFIGADLAPGAVAGPAEKQIKQLPIMRNLPSGVANAPVGEAKWQAELILNFIIAVISGIFLVFAVLVLLYKRFVSPLVNMVSLLLAPLGGLLAIGLIGQPVSISVYIGILMLLGIVAKNSILLIDFALEEMAKGVKQLPAILDAGHKRAQPIIMTTVAMTAGMVPTALSLSGDGSWRAPMGTTVIGGLLLSTVLTLLIVPAGFSLADGFERRIGPWLRTRFLTYRPGDEASHDGHAAEQGTAPAE